MIKITPPKAKETFNTTFISTSLLVSALAGLISCSTAPADEDDVYVVESGKLESLAGSGGNAFDVTGRVTIAAPASNTKATLLQATAHADYLVTRISYALEHKLGEIFSRSGQAPRSIIGVLDDATVTFADLQRTADQSYAFTYSAKLADAGNQVSNVLLDLEASSTDLDLALPSMNENLPQAIQLRFTSAIGAEDSYPRYQDMFADGLDMAIFIGQEIPAAEIIYDQLLELGLRPPVGSFDELALDSGPFTASLDVDGQSIEVRVTLIHGDMAPSAPAQLLVAFKEQAATADMVFYLGQASNDMMAPGIHLHNDPRSSMPTSSLSRLDLPEKYQAFVFDGCGTYSEYAAQLYQHPKKEATNLDVITATSWSPQEQGQTIRAVLQGMLARQRGTWMPQSWHTMLRHSHLMQLSTKVPLFSLHGLEDNPQTSPLTDLDSLGQSCHCSQDCRGIDNLCIRASLSSTFKSCGIACTSNSACPSGTSCKLVSSGVKQCTR